VITFIFSVICCVIIVVNLWWFFHFGEFAVYANSTFDF